MMSEAGEPTTKKRARGELKIPVDADDIGEDKKNRGNYRCSRCNLPKKGHVCPYQPRLKRKDLPEGSYKDTSVQVEMDKDMVVRNLALDRQGLPESYLVVKNLIQSSAGAATSAPSLSSSSSAAGAAAGAGGGGAVAAAAGMTAEGRK